MTNFYSHVNIAFRVDVRYLKVICKKRANYRAFKKKINLI